MITNREIKIKIIDNLTSNYIEEELNKLNLDIFSWAIVNIDESFYTLNVSVVSD